MSHTLLLADDSITIQRVIELTFAEEDIRVVVVGDGQQAIDRLSADAPDIVLADIGMPKRSGYDVATFVKTQPALAGIPVLLLSGAFEALDEARVKASGADGVLVKPFEPSAVIGRVKELLGIGKAQPAAAASASGRMITPPEPPAPRAATPPVAPAPPRPPAPVAAPGAAWEELRETSGLGVDAASVEGRPASADNYLDNLDAAFDTLDARLSNPGRPVEAPMPPRAPAAGPAGESPVFEVEDEWFGPDEAGAAREQATMGHATPPAPAPPPAAAPTASVLPAAATFAGPPPSVADAFAALLADEQGEAFRPAEPTVAITDRLVEDVAARVATKLATDGMSAEIREIVVEAAERLVREEIRRIRGEAERRR